MKKTYHGIERRIEEEIRNETQRNVVQAIIAHCITRSQHAIVPVVLYCRYY
jgi:hypothetical protein